MTEVIKKNLVVCDLLQFYRQIFGLYPSPACIPLSLWFIHIVWNLILISKLNYFWTKSETQDTLRLDCQKNLAPFDCFVFVRECLPASRVTGKRFCTFSLWLIQRLAVSGSSQIVLRMQQSHLGFAKSGFVTHYYTLVWRAYLSTLAVERKGGNKVLLENR